MAQPARKTIVVCGATGKQGGAVVDALLRRGAQQFAVRSIVRNATSAKAEALARQGAEVVAANYDDPASLPKAFSGAHGAFCITNYWQGLSLALGSSTMRALTQSCAGRRWTRRARRRRQRL